MPSPTKLDFFAINRVGVFNISSLVPFVLFGTVYAKDILFSSTIQMLVFNSKIKNRKCKPNLGLAIRFKEGANV